MAYFAVANDDLRSAWYKQADLLQGVIKTNVVAMATLQRHDRLFHIEKPLAQEKLAAQGGM